LANGIQKFENYCQKLNGNQIEGPFAFELFDTYGFPIDLTQLLASEKNLNVDMEGFQKGLEKQKTRSRAASTIETEDWVELISDTNPTQFVGYHALESDSKIVKYRLVKSKGKQFYQLVLNKTPFYAESGGQVGDTGVLMSINEKIEITNTIKENNLTVHIAPTLPDNLATTFIAVVNKENRVATQNNHSATHLLHYALRKVVGKHVEQKGSFVSPERFRFDFSHFSKVTDEQLTEVESLVNQLVRNNVSLFVFENLPIEEARGMGAMALFGEKYGDHVRVIQFGDSIELCGGTHTSATGNIGYIKIVSESAIAAGIRRIEAISGKSAESYINESVGLVNELKGYFGSPNIMGAIQKMNEEIDRLKKEVEEYEQERIQHFAKEMVNSIQNVSEMNIISYSSDLSPEIMKQAAYKIKNHTDHLLVVFGSIFGEKPNLIVALSDDLVEKGMNASQLVREAAVFIQGGGGGQPGLATAGGKNCNGMDDAIKKVIEKGCSIA